jgi:hypothetical protein
MGAILALQQVQRSLLASQQALLARQRPGPEQPPAEREPGPAGPDVLDGRKAGAAVVLLMALLFALIFPLAVILMPR